MIDVPILVKDALRDGRRLKNYKFKISRQVHIKHTTYNTISVLDLNDDVDYIIYADGAYRFYNANANSGVTLQIVNGSVTETKTIPAEPEASKTEFVLEIAAGSTITLLSSSVALELQSVIETDDPEWEYLFTIENDCLVSESVSFDERMSSGDIIKFGLCEGTLLEFQYFNKPNIFGDRIEASVEVQYLGDNGLAYYEIPMGFFQVKKCARQASTGIIRVSAYNKLQSDYLDSDGNQLLIDLLNGSASNVTLYDIQKNLLSEYQVDMREDIVEVGEFTGSLFTSGISSNYKKRTFTSGQDTSPLNIQMMGGSATSTSSFTFSVNSSVSYWNLDPDESYTLSVINNIDALEDKFYSYLSDAVTKSGVNNPASFMSKLVSTITLVQEIAVSIPSDIKGWAMIFAVVLIKRDGTWEWYSKVGKDNKRQKCMGTIEELSHLIITDCTKMLFMHVGNICKGVYSVGNPPEGIFYPLSDEEFTYYDTSRQVQSAIYLRMLDLNNQPYRPRDLFTLSSIDLSNANKITVDVDSLPKFTLRDIVDASYETVCQFGKLDRVTDLFSGVDLNSSRLYPAENLYPDNSLYPDGAALSSEKSMFSKLWGDEGNIQKWRYLIITYKGLDEEDKEKDFTLQMTVNEDGTQDYNMSDNWIFRNLIWTATQVREYAAAMVAKMQNMTWFPFEMWCAGLPYLETGDEIEITIGEETYISYVLQRQLKGIQNLQDTYINGTLDIF